MKPSRPAAASPFRQGLTGKPPPSAYLFAFGKKTLIMLAMGFTTAGLLLFVAGLLIGVSVRLPDHLTQAEKATEQVMALVESPAETPAITIQPSAPATPASIPDQPSHEPSTEPSQAPEERAIRTEASKVEVAQTIVQEPEPTVLSASTEPAEPSEAAESTVSPPAKTMAFTVQVGAFLVEREAEALVANLKRKGYEAASVRLWGIWNGQKRLWHTVRIGEYESREVASQAAAEFTWKENIPAIVRHSDVL